MDLYYFIGGALGAFLRQAATPERPTISLTTLIDVILGGVGTIAAIALGLVPEDIVKVVGTSWIRAVAISAVGGYVGVDFIRVLAARIAPIFNATK